MQTPYKIQLTDKEHKLKRGEPVEIKMGAPRRTVLQTACKQFYEQGLKPPFYGILSYRDTTGKYRWRTFKVSMSTPIWTVKYMR